MSGAIRDTEKLIQRRLEMTRNRGEKELKSIEAMHVKRKDDLKESHNAEIVDIQSNHFDHINLESEKKEKVLNEMKTQLDQTKKITDKELKNLKDHSTKSNAETQQKLAINRERINEENELYLEDMNNRFNQQSKKINHEGKLRIEQTKSSKNKELNDVQIEGNHKIQSQTEEFNTRFSHDANNYKNLKMAQDANFKKTREDTNQKQQAQMSKLSTDHTNHYEQKDKDFRKGLSEQELFFEKKYSAQLDRHKEEFKVLDAKNKKVVEDLKTHLTQEIKKTADRNDDPFFKFETLKPRLAYFEDRVEVRVDIPEHSKEDVQLTVNGKEAIVGFTRRFADANKDLDGTINKINKIESFSTRLKTDYFLDAKSLKSNYENGTMTFSLKKA